MRIKLFGVLQITVDGISVTAVDTPRLQSLLAGLLIQTEKPQSKERLASLLWPQSSGPQARTNLRHALHHLKRALPGANDLLKGDHCNIRWNKSRSCSVDVIDFQTALTNAARCAETQDAQSELQWLKQAVEIYGDDLLPNVYDEWLVPVREGLRSQLSTALYRLALLLKKYEDVPAAISCAERLVAQDATSENSHQLLMRLHIAQGDRASAVRTYHQCKAVLRRDLGLPPGHTTVALFEEVLKVAGSHPAQSGPVTSEEESTRWLIGRVSEMWSLEKAWRSVRSGGVLAVIVLGEPGIGKTKFAEEFLFRAERDRYAVARSRCHSGQVAYAPVTQWLRAGPVRAVWQALPSAQTTELARLVPEMCEAPPADRPPDHSDDSWQKNKLYGALDAVFAEFAGPLVLFVDDLHWCDAESLVWLQLFLTSGQVRSTLMIGTVRAEETGRGHPFSSFLGYLRQVAAVVELPLRALDKAETARLARQESTKPLVSERLMQIYDYTKGNPLFVVETVRAGLQSMRIHAVISARLAKLSAPAYELAGFASIVGRAFSLEVLEKASDWDERSFAEALDELWQRRIVEPRGGADYDFTHDRLREVASLELSPVRKRYLHRRVARALTEVYRSDIGEWSGQIAFHYEGAGMVEEAIEYLCAAADLARHRFAYTESAQILHRASTLLEQLPISTKRSLQELEVLARLGTALVTTEGYSAQGVGDTYGRALQLSRRLGGHKLFTILSGSWVNHVVGGRLETSRQEALEFLAAAEKTSNSELKLAGNFLLGSSLSHLGQLEASLAHLELALEIHKRSSAPVLEVFGGPDVRVFCRAYLSHVAWHRAPTAEDTSANAVIAEAVQEAEDMRHPFIQAIALNYSTMLHVLKGDSGSALTVGLQAKELCSRHAFAYYLAMANVLTAWAMCVSGESLAGLEQFRLGLETMRSLGAELRLPFYYALLSQAYGQAGMLREASASLATGFAFAGKNGEEWTISELYRVQGNRSMADGMPEQAVVSYQRALAAAERCGSLALARRLTTILQRIFE